MPILGAITVSERATKGPIGWPSSSPAEKSRDFEEFEDLRARGFVAYVTPPPVHFRPALAENTKGTGPVVRR